MQVKGQSSAADRMDVNQAKQEHLLALKGTVRFNLFLLWTMLRAYLDSFIHSFINIAEMAAVAEVITLLAVC